MLLRNEPTDLNGHVFGYTIFILENGDKIFAWQAGLAPRLPA